MRALFIISFLGLANLPGATRPAPPDVSPSAEAAPDNAQDNDRNKARWADLEAQARITDGDYDGAVQAEKQASAARDKANRRDIAARAARRP